jgi:DNA-binding Lrp family transcriptional regulator
MRSLRLPRFKRSPDIRPLRLTDRDREILKHTHRHRFLRSDHIVALTAGSPQQVLRRLQQLFHHGYLERPRCQIDYYQSGSRRIAYGLGNKGAAWLKRELSLPYHRLDWPRKNDVVRYFLEHALLVSDFMVALEIACRQRRGLRLLSEDDFHLPGAAAAGRNPFRWRVNIPGGPACTVIPDRVFGLEYADGTQAWFVLEADRATMPVSRRSLERSSFRRKLLAYQATWAQNLHHQFGWRRFRVLTVTTDLERIRGMIEACQRLRQGRGLFLFMNAKVFNAKTDFFSSCWQTTHRSETTGLLA